LPSAYCPATVLVVTADMSKERTDEDEGDDEDGDKDNRMRTREDVDALP